MYIGPWASHHHTLTHMYIEHISIDIYAHARVPAPYCVYFIIKHSTTHFNAWCVAMLLRCTYEKSQPCLQTCLATQLA
jgi:hypothetical protein